MDLKKYTRLLLRWWWVVVLGAACGAIGAYVVSQHTTPIYDSSITLVMNQAPGNEINPSYNDVLTSEHLTKTYAELLHKQPVLESVINKLGLPMTPAELADNVRVSVTRDTLLVVVTVEDTQAARAAATANEIADVFAQQTRELQANRYTTLQQSLQIDLIQEQGAINTIQATLATLNRDALQTELGQVNTNMNSVQANMAHLDVPHQVLQEQIDQLRGQIERIQNNPSIINTLGSDDQVARRSALQTQLQQHQTTYGSLQRNLADARLAEAQTADYVTVAEHASVPIDPTRPRTLLNILLAALLGVLATVSIGFLTEYLDNSVRTREEIERSTGLPTLATIGRIRKGWQASALITASTSGSLIAEAYRMLRTNIAFAQVDKPIRTIVISSSAPNEGKSTTAANLAVTMAQTGQRVVLVDLDLREPTLHQIFKVNNSRGITTALLHPEEKIGDYLLPTGVENLSLIPSGPLPSNPAELLGSQRMADLIDQLKTDADMILFDSSPLLLVTDASLLARRCDATLIVARAGSTSVNDLRQVREQLAQSRARLLGVVLNRVATSSADHRYQRRWRRKERAVPSSA